MRDRCVGVMPIWLSELAWQATRFTVPPSPTTENTLPSEKLAIYPGWPLARKASSDDAGAAQQLVDNGRHLLVAGHVEVAIVIHICLLEQVWR